MKNRGPVIYVIDDNESVRKSLARLLKAHRLDCQAFASCEDFLIAGHDHRPSCLVLDVRLPGMNGLELQEAMAQRDLDMPIIFITGHGTVPMSVKAMKAGAVDFLPKPFAQKELLEAIGRAVKKDTFLKKQKKDIEKVRRQLNILTPREFEVLRWVITGKLNKQIALCLGTTEKTIKVHRGRLMKKLRVSSVAQLVRLAQGADVAPALKV